MALLISECNMNGDVYLIFLTSAYSRHVQTEHGDIHQNKENKSFRQICQLVLLWQLSKVNYCPFLLKIGKIEIRAVIKYLFLKGLKPAEIIKDMNNTSGEFASSDATIYNWVAEFKRGRTKWTTFSRSKNSDESKNDWKIIFC